MPQEFPIHYQQAYNPNGGNMYGSSQQSTYSTPQYTNYSARQTKPQSPQKNDSSTNNNPDFHRFYGPVSHNISY